MAEELKIGVSAPGAKATEEDLKRVAAAESAVGQAAAGTAPGHAAAGKAMSASAEAAKELHLRDRSLLNELRAISPEVGVLVEALNVLTTRQTAAGIGLGLLGAAVGAVTIMIGHLNAAQAQEKQRLQEVLALLSMARDRYLEIAGAIEKARAGMPGPAAPPAEVTARAGALASEFNLSLEAMNRLAQGMGMPGVGPDQARMMAAGLAQQPGMAAVSPEMKQKFATERMEALAGLTPAAGIGRAFRQWAAEETIAGRPREAKHVQAYLEDLITRAGHGLGGAPAVGVAESPEEARAEIADILRRFPALRSGRVTRGLKMQWGMIPTGQLTQVGVEGEPIIQYLGPTFHGTTYVNADRYDPAGRPVPSPARY
jgi:hypothetical protein